MVLGLLERGSLNESLVLLQAFLGVSATLTIILSAESWSAGGRKRMHARWRRVTR